MRSKKLQYPRYQPQINKKLKNGNKNIFKNKIIIFKAKKKYKILLNN